MLGPGRMAVKTEGWVSGFDTASLGFGAVDIYCPGSGNF